MNTLLPLLAYLAIGAPVNDPPDYTRDVAPIFRKYCEGCHGADEPEKKFALHNYAALMKGGESGAAIVGGSADRSRLVQMITGKAKPVMPPEDETPPTADEIAKIIRWVEAGAKGPTGAAPDPTILVTPNVKSLAPVREAITTAAYSPDGKLLALGGYGEVRLIDPMTRQVVRRIASLRGNVASMAFSADGKQLVAAAGEPSLFGEATLCDVKSGKPIRKFTGHADSLYAVALSPDGKLLATGSYDQQIKLWDLATGKELRTLVGHNGGIYDLAFHPKGKILASASADRTIKLWRVADGERLDTLSQPLKEQYTLAFSPDGKQLAAGGVDNRIRVYGISPQAKENTNPILFTRFAHEGAVLRLAYSADGKMLVSSGEDKAVRLWNTKTYTELRQLAKQTDWPQAVAIAPDGKSLAVALINGKWGLFETKTGKVIAPPAPELASLAPLGIERGVKTKMLLLGKNLAAATGITVTGVEPKMVEARLLPAEAKSADGRWCEITIAGSVSRRTCMLAVVGEGGTSNTIPLYVDDLKQQLEAEPNDAEAAANLVSLPVTVWGAAGMRGDVDRYVFDGAAGQTVVAELSAKRIGSELDGMLSLLDPDGEVVASNNNFDGNADSLLAYTLPKAGRYTVRVQDLLAMGSAKSFYRLSIGAFPYVTGVFPLAIEASPAADGKSPQVELIGFNVPKGTMVAGVVKGDKVDVPIDAEKFRSLKAFQVMLSTSKELAEQEPNDTPNRATPLATVGSQGAVSANGRIAIPVGAKAGDVDLYKFDARKGQELMIETFAARGGSPIDTKIEVLDAKGRPVDRVLLQAVLDSYVTFRPITSDAPDVRVKNWEEMELNELMYMQGEVCKIFRMPQGPDSGFQFYTNAGKRRAYFDTSSTAHAMDDLCYIVEALKPGEPLTPNGLPVFALKYVNDDDGERELGSDSRLAFTAPADGTYIVRVSDVRGFGGERFVYRLTVRPRKPSFDVKLATTKPSVSVGSGVAVLFRADRIDGMDEDIRIDVSNVPEGFKISSPVIIQAGHSEARTVLTVDQPDRKWMPGMKCVATAIVDGSPVTRDVASIAAVTVGEPAAVAVSVEPAEITIAPGTVTTATLRIERRDFNDPINFDVLNLPHGVIVENIGLNGILIPAGQTERQVSLRAADWVPEIDRTFFAETKTARKGKAVSIVASYPVTVHVRKASTLAQADADEPPSNAPAKN